MPAGSSDSPQPLLHQWVMAGIVSASGRFIPFPFVDDLVRQRCRRFVVARTLESCGSELTVDDLRLYYDGGGCLTGCAGWLLRAPLKILLFPIRKVVALVTSVRGVPLEIMRMVLIGRTLQRYVMNGWLTDASLAPRMRVAFDEAFAHMDFRVALAATKDALSHASGWKSAAIKEANRLLDRDRQRNENMSPEVEAGASQVERVLETPEMLALFEAFDHRFDEAMQATEQGDVMPGDPTQLRP